MTQVVYHTPNGIANMLLYKRLFRIKNQTIKTSQALTECSSFIDILHKKYKKNKKPIRQWCGLVKCGGDKGIRTPDLRIANATLYQLSHIPTFAFRNVRFVPCCVIIAHYLILTINF